MSFIRLNYYHLKEETDRIIREFAELPEKMELVQARAINRTLLAMRSEAIRFATGTYTAKGGALRKKSEITPAKAGRLIGRLDFKDKPGIGLINFLPRPASVISWRGIAPKNRRKVVTNQIRRDGSRKVYKDKGMPFVANIKGEKVIVTRKGKDNKSGQDKLVRLFGPSLVNALYGGSHVLEKKAEEMFLKRLRHEIEYQLSKNA